MEDNGFFTRMCKEAMEELASGERSWKEIDTNTLFLACFGMLNNHLTHTLVRPLWFFASAIVAGVVWYIISGVLHLG